MKSKAFEGGYSLMACGDKIVFFFRLSHDEF